MNRIWCQSTWHIHYHRPSEAISQPWLYFKHSSGSMLPWPDPLRRPVHANWHHSQWSTQRGFGQTPLLESAECSQTICGCGSIYMREFLLARRPKGTNSMAFQARLTFFWSTVLPDKYGKYRTPLSKILLTPMILTFPGTHLNHNCIHADLYTA